VALKPWRYTGCENVADLRIFRVLRETAVSPRTGETHDFTRVESPAWVNIVPLTTDGQVVLVRQWRHGIKDFTLEIPGGLVDAGETPAAAASREVREETGHAGDAPVEIGVVEANPAFMPTLTHTFLIENCRAVGAPDPDPGEDLEVVLHPLAEIPALVAHGEIRHSLVICGFWWLALRRPDLLRLAER
jgi:8-oxo-dGTP pyrophosphatase MutT (NUDIX family)